MAIHVVPTARGWPSADPRFGCDNELVSLIGWVRQFLPEGRGAAGGIAKNLGENEFPDERNIMKNFSEKRSREFHCGRILARNALLEIGCSPMPILSRKERDPVWPEGFIGSITHSGEIVVAVSASSNFCRGIGIDVEENDPLDRTLVDMICRREEQNVAGLATLGIDHAKLRFVAKEAFYKAVFPLQRRFIDFQEVRIILDISSMSFFVETFFPNEKWCRSSGIGHFTRTPRYLMAYFCCF